jgi:hypothetical protein
LPTNLVDFTTEPRVAAFFASHSPPPSDEGEDLSCIICLDYDELKNVYESVKIVRPDMPEPRRIVLNVPDLWRIQSQHGVFLEYPFDAGFERHNFGCDRIVFPTERNPTVLASLSAVEDIYPTQKSDLEMLLDQFFMLEKMAEGTRMLEELARDGGISTLRQSPISDGIEAECFGRNGLPEHESWNRSVLTEWHQPEREDWRPVTGAPCVHIAYPSRPCAQDRLNALQEQLAHALRRNPQLRRSPVKWMLSGLPSGSPRVTRALELVWDGIRRWPYSPDDIVQALATVIEYGELVAQEPDACQYQAVAHKLAQQCFGDAVEVEVGVQDSSYTRGYAAKGALREAVREDFFSFVADQWRPQIKDVRHILQIAFNPRRTFVFDRLKSVFCTQIVPTQVVLRDENSGKARLYNLSRATTIGLP